MTELVKAAPFIGSMNEENRETAVRTLEELVRAGHKAKIKIIDPRSALISFPGTNIVLPAERDASGSWTLSETLIRRQTIDFIPAAE